MLNFLSKHGLLILAIAIIFSLYYKFFLFGKIPFPGDLLVVSYAPWFDYFKFPVQNPLISDVFSQFFLWKHLAVDIIKSGQWPLWNPYSFTGTPLLATYHSAALYPLNILLLLPKYWGWGLLIFSQTLIGFMGMYLLLSLWLNSKLARLTGSAIFALGGLMTTWLELGTAVHAIIWLPFSMYFVERFWAKLQIRYLLLLCLTEVLLVLAGHAQILTYSLIILSLYILISALNKKSFLIRFLPPIVTLILGLLVSAIQLLPSIDLLNKSIRLTESYTGEFNFGLLPLRDFLKFFLADFYGNPVTRNYWGFLNYSETSGFIGSLTLPLILFAYFYLKNSKVILFLKILLPVSLILTFDNFLSHMIYQLRIPQLTSSYAGRMLFVSTFLAAFLSAFAMNQISNKAELKKLFKMSLWSLAAISGVLIGTVLSYQICRHIVAVSAAEISENTYLKDYLGSESYPLSNISVSIRNSLIPFSISAGFVILFFFISRGWKNKTISQTSIIMVAIFTLISFDLGRYFLKFNPFVSQNLVFPETPALNFLQKQQGIFRVGREHAEVLPPNTWLAYNLQSLEGYDPLYLNHYAKFMNFLNGVNIKSGGSSRYAELTLNYSSPHVDAANVRYFVGLLRNKNGIIPGDLIDYRFVDAGFKKVFQDKSTVILENKNALDRVYFAKSFRVVAENQMEDIFIEDSSFDPRKEVLLLSDLNVKTITGSGTATITNYSPNIVRVSTKTESDEILILTDQFDNGWKAKIDNQDSRVSITNLTFRAIKIPKGEHEVIFYYSPKSFEIGLKISIASLILIFAFLAFSKIRRIF